VTALIPSIMDSSPVSFPSAVGVATLTESLFSVKAHTLFQIDSGDVCHVIAAKGLPGL
jgi:hypothetical protein